MKPLFDSLHYMFVVRIWKIAFEVLSAGIALAVLVDGGSAERHHGSGLPAL
jgi:hypothetical protein